MRPATLTAAMAGAASAIVLPRIAILDQQLGFRLLVRVLDYDSDFTPRVNNKYVGGVHIGAALEGLYPIADGSKGPVFWANGTDAEIKAGQSHVFTDLDNGMYPLGWDISKSPESNVASAVLVAGTGSAGVSVFDGGKDGPAYLLPEDYMACLRPAPYTGELAPFILQRDTKDNGQLPDKCIAIKLLPECASLPDLPASATYNRDHGYKSRCYVDAVEGYLPHN